MCLPPTGRQPGRRSGICYRKDHQRDGTPGPNFCAGRAECGHRSGADAFLLIPAKTPLPNNVLPAPLVGGPADSYITGDSLTLAQQSENGLPPSYYQYLVSGGTG